MTEYTRVTIVGTTRKAEMVVPGDEAIGSMIPRLMQLLDERPGGVSRPLTLVRSTGEQLDTSLSVVEQSVVDGEVLRLLREDAAPPPPEVADVTDVLAESRDDRADLWSGRSRRAVSLTVVGAASLLAGTILGRDVLSPVGVGALYVAALLVAVIAARVGGRLLGSAATAVAVGLSVPIGVGLPGMPSAFRPAAVGDPAVAASGLLFWVPPALAIGALVWLAVSVGVGAGLGSRSAWWGGVIGVLSSALPLVLIAAGVGGLGAIGVGAVVATFACGLLPWYAMSASGLTGLDDQVVEGRLKRRDTVLVTARTAYRTLSWSTAAVALPIGVTAAALLASADGWAIGLGAGVVVVAASRTRAMPLAGQGYALWAAAAGGLLVGAAGQWTSRGPVPLTVVLAVLAGSIVVAVIAAGVSPAEHQRASLRRLGNLAEAIAVASLLPVLVGLFGVYTELLGAF